MAHRHLPAAWSGLLIALASALAEPGAGAGLSPERELARQLNRAFIEVADEVSPSVVVIRVVPKDPTARDLDGDGEPDEFFNLLPRELRRRFEEQLERRRQEREREQGDGPRQYRSEEYTGQGSGVVIRKDGFILTNRHVVSNAERIEVRLKDGRRLPAEVRGVDAESDIAVVKVEAEDLPVARLGDSAAMRVGEFTIAIGAPFELDYSVTFGHLSAKGRRVVFDALMMDQDFLQTDASINPGNSGGPLVNIEGEVIGINTMIRGMNTGIGFAVPINLAREVAEKLIAEGRFARAWLGIGIATVGESDETTPAGLPVKEGVLVREVMSAGPAASSELKAADVIVAVDGTAVRSVNELKQQVRTKAIGTPVTLDVYRGSKKLQVQVAPGELPPDRSIFVRRSGRPQGPAEGPEEEVEPAANLGLEVEALTPELAERIGLEKVEGVVITRVGQGSLADRQGLEPGEIITRVNRKPVTDADQFRAAVAAGNLEQGISFTVVGEEGRRFEMLGSGR